MLLTCPRWWSGRVSAGHPSPGEEECRHPRWGTVAGAPGGLVPRSVGQRHWADESGETWSLKEIPTPKGAWLWRGLQKPLLSENSGVSVPPPSPTDPAPLGSDFTQARASRFPGDVLPGPWLLCSMRQKRSPGGGLSSCPAPTWESQRL